jgi:hypothetical protein
MSLPMTVKQPQSTSTLTTLRFPWTTYQNSWPINFLATELLTLRLPTKLSFSTLLQQACFSQPISHNHRKIFTIEEPQLSNTSYLTVKSNSLSLTSWTILKERLRKLIHLMLLQNFLTSQYLMKR